MPQMCKNSRYTLNNNVFSLFLNVVRVMSGDLSSSERLPHTRSIDGKTTIVVVCSGVWNSQKTGTDGSKMTAGAC